ncbi:4-hydroxy-2-oxoheptanedioate aldolase/2-dehydro-3-deoxy-L-rhamnonate aldolase [Cricetibacter osteomyelitidis]|uniref:4-hydroxy-2-oxoheptanedioate aldolase/2-dehydro-3-deoxy-L-rhamnonate aldolase n=1 Tax=Cricetibacter osteomyelitidis TaxID=1521931 RepID=A0A4R2TFM8_9PAST|nr:aldolase/citrate lyase family protein [Cricetibacter osteomyelitidis]TCP96008.1 4-hydroxy-2-oxoheptanedioate aldolase/2-dehydro-3-deoxy-L-rhamnonate aldolase [Cricetibacter osteomyelitidis]
MPMVKDYLYNSFKHNIEAGKMQFGVGLETTSADVAEALATTDFDWLFIDGEHGPHTVQTILAAARAIAPYDMTPVVRIGEAGTGIIKQLMDAGIQNIIVPKLESGEEAEQILYWASYPSRGNRGMGASAFRAARFGRYPDYQERIENETMIMLQIESKKGMENLDDIVKTKGLGAIFLGPVDLAIDMGHGMNIFHPEVVEAMEYAIKRIQELGVPVGTIAATPEQAKHYAEMGVTFLGIGADTMFLTAMADNTLASYQAALK